jgi:hypothetical protein
MNRAETPAFRPGRAGFRRTARQTALTAARVTGRCDLRPPVLPFRMDRKCLAAPPAEEIASASLFAGGGVPPHEEG